MAMTSAGVRPDAHTYTSMINVAAMALLPHLGGGSDVATAVEMMDRMKADGVPVGAATYASVLMACQRSSLPQHGGGPDTATAWRVLQEAVKAELHPEEVLHLGERALRIAAMATLPECGGGADVATAWKVYDLLAQQGVTLSLNACNHLLAACAKAKLKSASGGSDVLGARRVLHGILVGAGLKPDVVAFNTMLLACANAKDSAQGAGADVTTAHETMELLRSHHVEPDLITYKLLITTHAMCNTSSGGSDAAAAWAVLERMRGAGLEPDAEAYKYLTTACARSRLAEHGGGADLEGARRAVTALEKLRAGMQESASESYDVSASRAGAYEWLLQAHADARVEACGGGSDALGALKVLDDMMRLGVMATPMHLAAAALACSRSCHAEHGGGPHAEGALQVLQGRVQAHPQDLPLACFHQAMATCAQAKGGGGGRGKSSGAHVEGAWRVLSLMHSARVQPTQETYTWLLRACVASKAKENDGGSDSAGAWRVLKTQGDDLRRPPTLQQYRALVAACAGSRLAQNGGGADVHGAHRALRHAREHAVELDVALYLNVLHICAAGKLPEHGGGADVAGACEVVAAMASAGLLVVPPGAVPHLVGGDQVAAGNSAEVTADTNRKVAKMLRRVTKRAAKGGVAGTVQSIQAAERLAAALEAES